MTSNMTRAKAGKQISCRVHMLDDQDILIHIDPKTTGHELFTMVCNQIDLLERDYFSLEYLDSRRNPCWIEGDKPVLKQVTETKFSFAVKFYTPDPGQLEEELTRYLFALQIKRDLRNGTLLCSDNTATLLASYIVQAEIGDYLDSYNNNPSYLNHRKFFPHQTTEHELRIMNFHKNHLGQTAADADLNLLDIARKVELYGIKMHASKDHEQVQLNLSVAHMGILVFQNITKINTFSWAKIRKLSFKRKKFLIKLQPEGYGYYKDTVEFYFDTRDDCKNFWKHCIEYHAFFRCVTTQRPQRSRSKLLTRGSSFRYNGRTQKELIEYAREHYSKSRTFNRSYSNTRTVAPVSHRSHRSPGSTLKTSDTIDSVRHPRTPSTHVVEPIDVYQQVYHDDSSTHGSRTLDSRFSREKYDSSDDQQTDDDDDDHDEQTTATKSINGQTISPSTHVYRSSEPFQVEIDRITEHSASSNEQHRRQISGFVNNHRSVPPMTSATPPQQSSNHHRYSLQNDIQSSPTHETRFPSPPPPILSNRNEENFIDESKTRTIPIIREYRTMNIQSESPTRTISSASYQTMSPVMNISVRNSSNVQPIILPTSISSTMIISSSHDRSFFICKELLMTERTYKKDLEVIAKNFRQELMSMINQQQEVFYEDKDQFEIETLIHLSDVLFPHFLPIYNFHLQFLRQLEQRITVWETRSISGNESEKISHHIGDLIAHLVTILPRYERYIENYDRLLTELEYILKHNRRFDLIYKEFENDKCCYLSIISFLVKPLQRLLHYGYLFQKLLLYYKNLHHDAEYQECYGIYIKIQDLIDSFTDSLPNLLNRQKLLELQRDLIGVENLSNDYDLQFIREGCLQKYSRKGYQQRMFFLFSDVLLYCARSSSQVLQFKLHGELPLKSVVIEDNDGDDARIPNSFTIYTGNRSLLLAASSSVEKTRWFNDLKRSIETQHDAERHHYTSTIKSNASSENLDHSVLTALEDEETNPMERSCIQHRANTTMHVCWHRHLSVSIDDHRNGIENQLSGYLLRKFKNSNGWQKLWVVFTNFCLFFYKTYQDDFPLASLPLLGYRSSLPSEDDSVNKDFVFKLQFKNHVYFFRAESQYTFDRWMEVISSVTRLTTNPSE